MKKLLFILSLIALMSCEKPPEYCWQCNKERFAPNAYASTVQIICDKTEDEIRDFEKQQTRDLSGVTVVMTCRLYNN